MEAIKPHLEQEAIKAQVRQYIAANFLMGANVAELGDDDSFMGQNVIDSAGVLELIAYLEHQGRRGRHDCGQPGQPQWRRTLPAAKA